MRIVLLLIAAAGLVSLGAPAPERSAQRAPSRAIDGSEDEPGRVPTAREHEAPAPRPRRCERPTPLYPGSSSTHTPPSLARSPAPSSGGTSALERRKPAQLAARAPPRFVA